MTGRVKFETTTSPPPARGNGFKSGTTRTISRANKRHRFAQVLAATRGRRENQIVGHVYLLPVVAKFRLDIHVALTNHFPIQNELPNWIYSGAFGDFPIIIVFVARITASFPMSRSGRDNYYAWL
jgi:hypothetical protein